MKVLLIDKGQEAANIIRFTVNMRWPGATLLHVEEATAGIKLVDTESPDVVFLETALPDMDGFEALRQIRLFSDVPIVLLGSGTSEVNKVRGLELGADDHIGRPISPLDLLARVQAIFRRTGMRRLEELPPFSTPNLTIDFSTRNVVLNGNQVHLTPTEYRLLCCLVRNEGKVILHDTIRRQVWDESENMDSSIIKTYVYKLRLKLGDTADPPQIILNERGIGYRFTKPAV